jgi:hypothetical protein
MEGACPEVPATATTACDVRKTADSKEGVEKTIGHSTANGL